MKTIKKFLDWYAEVSWKTSPDASVVSGMLTMIVILGIILLTVRLT